MGRARTVRKVGRALRPRRAPSPPRSGVLIAGTTSDAGKSFVATGLCRLLVRRGWSVRPFKAVNMSLNSVPAGAGAEIALAQWVQCRAARVVPSAQSNPVLLKPTGRGVEIVLHGQARWQLESWRRDMPRYVARLRAEIRAALRALVATGAFVVAEGAGSPAEVNLRATDLANLFVADEMDSPVLLVADLDRGGALAQVVGTWEILSPRERRRVQGLIFNRLRGDPAIFTEARRWVERKLGIPVVGVLPALPASAGILPPEDALRLTNSNSRLGLRVPKSAPPVPRIGILRLPHTANFSDFAELESSIEVEAEWIDAPRELDSVAALLLPGSRRTRDDLAWMHAEGWPRALAKARRRGLGVGGVCGGYQMMGATLDDPSGFEGAPGRSRGLGLLPIRTRFVEPKIVRSVVATPLAGHPWAAPGVPSAGFEIHRGRSERLGAARPLYTVRIQGSGPAADESDGAVTDRGRVWGTVLHGILNSPTAARGIARWARSYERPANPFLSRPPSSASELFPHLDRTIDAIADLLEAHLDLPALGRILGRPI